eukprot:11478999-Heterocapsa_arctica.AAC.1
MSSVCCSADSYSQVLKLERSAINIISAGPTASIATEAMFSLDLLIGSHSSAPSLKVHCSATVARTALVSVKNWRASAAMVDEGWMDLNRAISPRLSA